jgi:hypothetical protein
VPQIHLDWVGARHCVLHDSAIWSVQLWHDVRLAPPTTAATAAGNTAAATSTATDFAVPRAAAVAALAVATPAADASAAAVAALASAHSASAPARDSPRHRTLQTDGANGHAAL